MSRNIGVHLPRGKCRVCGKECALYAPTGDYLQAIFPRRHTNNGKPCDGNLLEVHKITKDPERMK